METQNIVCQQMHELFSEDRASLGEKTIVGLCVLREAVWFCDPVGHKLELLKISLALK